MKKIFFFLIYFTAQADYLAKIKPELSDEEIIDFNIQESGVSEDKRLLEAAIRSENKIEIVKKFPLIWPVEEGNIQKVVLKNLHVNVTLKKESEIFSMHDGIVVSIDKEKKTVYLKHQIDGDIYLLSIVGIENISAIPGQRILKRKTIGKGRNLVINMRKGRFYEPFYVDPAEFLPPLSPKLIEVIIDLKK